MNYILLEGATPQEAKKALQNLANLYHDTGYLEQVHLYQHRVTESLFLIRFSVEPDFERFKYFVNYLAYPEEVEYQAVARGYYSVEQQATEFPRLNGKRLLLFLSENDTEGDNVFAVDQQHQNYKLGFASGAEFKELPLQEKLFDEPTLDMNHYLLLAKISPDTQIVEKEQTKSAGYLPVLAVMALLLVMVFWS